METMVYYFLYLVLQKALAFAIEPYLSILKNAIVPHLEKLKHHFPFGNKLYIKLINTYSELTLCNTVEPVSNENNNSYIINQKYNFNKRISNRNFKTADSQKMKSKFSSNYYN